MQRARKILKDLDLKGDLLTKKANKLILDFCVGKDYRVFLSKDPLCTEWSYVNCAIWAYRLVSFNHFFFLSMKLAGVQYQYTYIIQTKVRTSIVYQCVFFLLFYHAHTAKRICMKIGLPVLSGTFSKTEKCFSKTISFYILFYLQYFLFFTPCTYCIRQILRAEQLQVKHNYSSS